MEALLTGWLDGLDAGRIIDDASVSEARSHAREVCASQGLPTERSERVALVASELVRNALLHGRLGRFATRAIARNGVAGVELVVADAGPGIADPTKALEGRPRSTGSLGIGLATARENADEIDFDVRRAEGTCIRARFFATGVERRREVGIYGRPHPEETKSGDHAGFHRTDDALLLAVCDGLGHGLAAREASLRALETVAAHRDETPLSIIESCHRAMAGTRGGVMAVLRARETSSLDLASIGNITVEIARPKNARRFAATSFVVGSAQKGWRANVEATTAGPDETIVLFSDGIPSRVSLGDEPDLLREHPIVIAHQLVQRHGRDTDDVLVLVAR